MGRIHIISNEDGLTINLDLYVAYGVVIPVLEGRVRLPRAGAYDWEHPRGQYQCEGVVAQEWKLKSLIKGHSEEQDFHLVDTLNADKLLKLVEN